MKPIMRNRHHAHLESAMQASKDGKAPHGFAQKPDRRVTPKGAIFKRIELNGEMVYLPVNRVALEEFMAMTDDEKATLMLSQPPTTIPVPLPCESKRIVQGARFKALPRGIREGDVFRGNEVRPIRPTTTGSLAALNSRLLSTDRKRIRSVEKKDIVGNAMRMYNLSYEDALLLIEGMMP